MIDFDRYWGNSIDLDFKNDQDEMSKTIYNKTMYILSFNFLMRGLEEKGWAGHKQVRHDPVLLLDRQCNASGGRGRRKKDKKEDYDR